MLDLGLLFWWRQWGNRMRLVQGGVIASAIATMYLFNDYQSLTFRQGVRQYFAGLRTPIFRCPGVLPTATNPRSVLTER